MLVLARFPNARWSDKSMFIAVANWFRSSTPGVHNTGTGEGLLRGTPKCANESACCALCNHHDLAASGINATGALAIMNLWSCDTGVQRVTKHDWSEPSVLHHNATWLGLCDDHHHGDGRFYLEGLRSFLDDQEEWLFDGAGAQGKQVLLARQPAPGAVYSGRVSTHALVVDDARFVGVVNLSFFATTVDLSNDVGNVTLASLEFNYSAVSRRSLGDIAPPATFNVWRTKAISAGGSLDGQFVLEDVVVRHSDGPALMLSGGLSTLRDCLFEWNDWTTVGGSWFVAPPALFLCWCSFRRAVFFPPCCIACAHLHAPFVQLRGVTLWRVHLRSYAL